MHLAASKLDWASENNWQRVEVYGTNAGLFPAEWYDHCIPPRPFWEGRGFTVFAKHGDSKLSAEDMTAIKKDNPRHNDAEQQQKREILASLQSGNIDPELYGYTFDIDTPGQARGTLPFGLSEREA